MLLQETGQGLHRVSQHGTSIDRFHGMGAGLVILHYALFRWNAIFGGGSGDRRGLIFRLAGDSIHKLAQPQSGAALEASVGDKRSHITKRAVLPQRHAGGGRALSCVAASLTLLRESRNGKADQQNRSY